MRKYRGVKIPPIKKHTTQIWWCSTGESDTGGRIRMINSSGEIHYMENHWDNWQHGCTSRPTQREAVKMQIAYSWNNFRTKPVFVGYVHE